VHKIELVNLYKIFKILDKDHDGKLSMSDIREAYLYYIGLDSISYDEID
jgi:Ca2+-binding EF-hand superfamily protein